MREGSSKEISTESEFTSSVKRTITASVQIALAYLSDHPRDNPCHLLNNSILHGLLSIVIIISLKIITKINVVIVLNSRSSIF